MYIHEDIQVSFKNLKKYIRMFFFNYNMQMEGYYPLTDKAF